MTPKSIPESTPESIPDTPVVPPVASHGELLLLLVDSTHDYAMFTLDTRGRFNSWNVGAERVLGCTEAEIVGQPLGVIYTNEDRAVGVPERELQAALATGRAENERWHLRKNGSHFWGSGVVTPLADPAGNHTGYAKILRDLSERQQYEEALERANAQLEQRVTERTAALATATGVRRELLRRLVSAQEVERGRISRDLHDVVGQTITALSLGIGNLKSLALAPDAQHVVTELSALVMELAEQTHRLSFALRPTVLDDLGLGLALVNHVTHWQQWNSLPVDLQTIGLEDERLPGEMETTVYRMVQEALTNVSRYAQGTGGGSQVGILVQRGADYVQAVVEDDGPGFDWEAVQNAPLGQRRLGLFGIEERAALVGGTLSVETSPGKGTTLLLRIPFV